MSQTVDELYGMCADCELTVDSFIAMCHDETEMEQNERHVSVKALTWFP